MNVLRVWAVSLALCLLVGQAAAQFFYGDAEVVDGDTLVVDGVTIRLFGIDAPEGRQICAAAAGSEWPCGTAATERLVELIELGPVACQGLELDDFGRVVAICDAYDGATINRTLVVEGLAWAFVRYSTAFVADEDAAREAGLGIWQSPTIPAWEYRNQLRTDIAASPPDGCLIKGNVNRDGERIYHLPEWPTYEDTVIQIEEGERWFCTVEDARNAGWRPALGS